MLILALSLLRIAALVRPSCGFASESDGTHANAAASVLKPATDPEVRDVDRRRRRQSVASLPRSAVRETGLAMPAGAKRVCSRESMFNIKHALNRIWAVLLGLAHAWPVLAADQPPAQSYPWTWWHGMHWSPFGWIFLLLFFVMMIAIFAFMVRGRCMPWMWRDRRKDNPEMRDAMERFRGESSDSALDILNKRFAKGEIDAREYEEKKAAISR